MEVGLEDGLQDELERPLDDSVPDRRDTKDTDLPVALGDRLLPVPLRPIRAVDKFVPDLLEEGLRPSRLDGLERDPVNAG